MSLSLNITLDTKGLARKMASLSPARVTVVANQAINQTLTGLRTDATRYLAEKTAAKRQKTLRNRFIIERSTRSTLRGALVIPNTNMPLSNVKGVRVTKRGRHVTWKGKRIKAFRIKGQVGSLKDDLFFRVPGRKSPVRGYAYTLQQAYRKFRTHEYLRERALERFHKRFKHGMKR